MLTLGEVRGQDRVVEFLNAAIHSGRVAHAYLFAGPAGVGKHATGLALAKALNCLREPGIGCHECEACSKIDDGIHPDVRTLETQGAQQRIPIETIRKEVIPALGLPPHEAKARVFLIEECSSMAGPAANALLKTLEEPPSRTHFILGTVAPTQILPTIRSRCQRINFQSLPPELAADLRGDEEGAAEIRQLCEAMVEVTDARGLVNILDVAKGFGDRAKVLASLAQFASHWHQRAREAADQHDLASAQIYGQRAAAVLESLLTVRDHNAHGQLTLEHLLVQLRTLRLPSAGAQSA